MDQDFVNAAVSILNQVTLLKKRNEARRRRINKMLLCIRSRRRKNATDLAVLQERLRRLRMLIQRILPEGPRRRLWAQPELLHNNSFESHWEKNVPHYSDERFLKKFRLSRNTFSILVDAVRPYLEREDTKFRKCIPTSKRVAIALYALKSNCDFWTIADWFRVGKSTVPYILYEFCDVVNTFLFNDFVKYPKDMEEKKLLAKEFYSHWQFPNCFGSLDGTHIPVIAPSVNAMDYFNYKQYHSIVVLALVDAQYKFTYVNIGKPGRVNDATVFNNSSLKAELQTCGDYFIVADGAFPLLMNLMKPYLISNGMSLLKKNFNRRLSRGRVVVEDAFGRLKGRWRILMKRADMDLENTKKVIATCVMLHNLCELQREPYLHVWQENVNNFNVQFPNPDFILNERTQYAAAVERREHLATVLLNDNVHIQTC